MSGLLIIICTSVCGGVKQARKEQESGWAAKWFEQRGPHGTFCYKGGYWEAREKKEWKGIPEIYNIDELEIAK